MKPDCSGKIWVRKTDRQEIRVMAFADGWVMARIKGCMPFVLMFNELKAEYEVKR
jgi:hypothetical protein